MYHGFHKHFEQHINIENKATLYNKVSFVNISKLHELTKQ